MRTTAIILALCLGVQNCAPVTEPRSSINPVEENGLSEAYLLCLIRAAIRIDDRVSDATTIARAILPACSTERRNLQDLYTRGMSDEAQIVYRQRIHDHPEIDLEAATAIVAQLREGVMP